MGRRRLQEQTMKDNFLFAAVMLEEDNCRDILSCVLGIEIGTTVALLPRPDGYGAAYSRNRLRGIAGEYGRI